MRLVYQKKVHFENNNLYADIERTFDTKSLHFGMKKILFFGLM